MADNDSSHYQTGIALTMVPLDYLSVARFSGAETAAFLQSQLSADIDVLTTGAAGFACYCTPKGQVIGLLLVCKREEDFLVAGASALLPHILDRLKMFVLRTQVEFTLESGLTVLGLNPATDSFPGETFQPANLDLHYGFSTDAFEAATSCESFRAVEISQRVAWLGSETTEKFIPQMLGYDQIGAVSFSKGCYPGQEIVARTRYLGKVKRRPEVVLTTEPLTVEPAARVELRRDDTWLKGIVIDSTNTKGGTILFVVAPVEPELKSVELRYEGQIYRCATT
jgi:folate-binding protein YgfZ